MNLWFVCFEIDGTGFLVDAETKTQAIADAICAEQDERLLGRLEERELLLSEIKDYNNYSVNEVDMRYLSDNIFWGSCLGVSNVLPNIVVFGY